MRESSVNDSFVAPARGSGVKDLRRKGVAWHVREMDATNVPGTRGDRCLVFDCEGIVRRAWRFPRTWAQLDDDDVWALLDLELPPPRPGSRFARGPAVFREHEDVVDAARRAANARCVVNASATIDDGDVIVADDVSIADGRREDIHDAVAGYTAALRAVGTSPERAIVLVKRAVNEGLELALDCAEHVAKELVDAAVARCIATYYAD
jgi:hypothetical protein